MANSLHADLAEVMAEVGYVQKDGTFKAKTHSYKFASAEAVLKKVNAALSSRGIAVASSAELLAHNEDLSTVVVRLTLRFCRGDEVHECQGLGQGKDFGDKAVMKANTAALKYLVANAFLISWGEDPELEDPREPAPQAPAAKKVPAKRKSKKKEVEPPFTVGDIEGTKERAKLEEMKKAIFAFAKEVGPNNETYHALRDAWKKQDQEV